MRVVDSLIFQRPQSALLVLSVLAFVACEDGVRPHVSNTPAALLILSGQDQQGVVGGELANPLRVQVRDSANRPVANQVVNFKVVSGGGSVFAGVALTTAEGIAADRWTLGTSTADTQRVEARAVNPNTGQALVFGVFKATPVPAAPAHMATTAGDAQLAVVGTSARDSLAVQVTDKYGNAKPGVTVTWTVVAGGGSVSPATSVTNVGGIAQTQFTLGTAAGGGHQVTAKADTMEAITFSATGTSGPTAGLTLQRSAGGAAAGAVFTRQPIVLIVDANGNLVTTGSYGVTLSASNSAQLIGTATQSTTNGSVTFTGVGLDAPAGEYTLTYGAQVAGATRTVTQPLTVAEGNPIKYILSHSDTTVTAGSVITISAQLADVANRPVSTSGIVVNWSKKAASGSFSSSSSTTNANGIAAVNYTAGTTAEVTDTVIATDGSRSGSTTFKPVAGPKSKLGFVVQPTATGIDVAIAPAVKVAVQDQFGNTVLTSIDAITLSLGANPGGATLSGGGTRTAVNGVAGYSQLIIDALGTGYTLKGQASGLADATSSAFDGVQIGTVMTVDNVIVDFTIRDSSIYVIEDLSTALADDKLGVVKKSSVVGGDITSIESGFSLWEEYPRIVHDGATLFWNDRARLSLNYKNTRVYRRPISASQSQVLFDQQVGIHGLQVDDSYVYFVQDGFTVPNRLITIPKSGGSSATLVESGSALQAFTVDNGVVYYVEGSTEIWTIPRAGGVPQRIAQNVGDVRYDADMRVIDGRLYFTACDCGTSGATLGTVKSVPILGGSVTTHVSGLSNFAKHFVSDGTSIYVNDNATIRRYSLANFSNTTVMASGNVGRMGVDARSVYWTTTTQPYRVLKTRK